MWSGACVSSIRSRQAAAFSSGVRTLRWRGAVAVGICLLAGQVAARGPRIERGSLGLGRTYRPDAWNVLRLELRGGDEPFVGSLVVTCPQDGEHVLTYGEAISLAPGQRRTATLYVRPAATLTGPRARVVLVNQAGRPVHGRNIDSFDIREPVYGSAMSPTDVLVLVVGTAPAELVGPHWSIKLEKGKQSDSNLRQLGYVSGQTSNPGYLGIDTVTCSPAELPDDPLGYDAVDVVVWNTRAWESLSQGRLEALLSWVRAGGKLVYCPSAPPPSRNEPFSELLAYQHRFSEAVEATRPAAGAGEPRFDYDCPSDAARDERFVVGLNGFGVVVQLRAKRGPGRTSRDGQGELWESLFKTFFGTPHRVPASGTYYGSGRSEQPPAPIRAARTMVAKIGAFSGAGTPSLGLTLLLCAVLTVVAGPGEYLALRLIKRPNWTWWVMPLTLGAFCALALGIANRIHSGDLQMKAISVIDHVAGSPTAHRRRFVGLYSPVNERYQLAFPGHEPTMSGFSLEGLTWYWGRQSQFTTPLDVMRTPTGTMGVFQAATATTRFYQSRDVLSAEEVPIRIELSGVQRLGGSLRVSGQVSNIGPDALSGLCLLRGKRGVRLGALAAGERREFAEDVGPAAGIVGRGPLTTEQALALGHLDAHRNTVMFPEATGGFRTLFPEASKGPWTLVAMASPDAGVAELRPQPKRAERIRLYRILVPDPEGGAPNDD